MFSTYKFPHKKYALATILTLGIGIFFWVFHYMINFVIGKREYFYSFPHLMHQFATVLTMGIWSIVWLSHYYSFKKGVL